MLADRSTERFRGFARLVLVVGLMIVVVAGCELERTDIAPAERERPREVHRGGELTIAIQAGATRLDPHRVNDAGAFRIIENMYSTLFRYADAYPQIEPDLVTDYEVNDDHTRFALTIRDDAVFHRTGRAVTVEDVEYSLNRIMEMETRHEPLEHLERIELVSEHELVLHFTQPMSPLLEYLAHPMYAIVDRETVEAHDGDLSNTSAGSGPFVLSEWRRGRHAILDANPDYYVDGLPRLERLVYRPIEDETSRVIALENGEVDIVLDVPHADIDRLGEVAYLTVGAAPGTFWEYIGFNMQAPPFDDARVRQAVAWAIDREQLNTTVKFGHAHPITGGHIPEHHWAYAGLETYPEPDVERARELLRDAGHEDVIELELIVNAGAGPQVQAASNIAQMLRPIGIELEVRALESTLFFDRLANRDFDACLVGWVGLFDADEWLYPIYHSDGWANQQDYESSELDELLEQGRRVADRDARQEIYTEAQRIITEQAPTVFLYMNDQTTGYLNNVWDFNVHPTATTISLRETWIEPFGDEQ